MPSTPSDDANDSTDLEARVARLEQTVARLEDTVTRLTDAVEPDGTARPAREPQDSESPASEPQASEPQESASQESDAARTGSPSARPPRAGANRDAEAASAGGGNGEEALGVVDRLTAQVNRLLSASSEDWLSRVGVGLLLLGLVFLFKYAVDVGWLVPPVRVGFGAVLGGTLFALGARTYGERRRLGQVLFGGSSAAFYATIFAAFQLYGLLSYPYAFAAMVGVTVATFALAIQQDDALLSVIAIAGGLATPFLLASGPGSAVGFATYVCLVLAGAMAVYARRGWRSVLWTTVTGGWSALLAAVGGGAFGSLHVVDLVAVQGSIVFAWLLLGGGPVLRAWREATVPGSEGAGTWEGEGGGEAASWIERELVKRPPYVLVNASPLLALLASRLLWTGVGDAVWGSVALTVSVLYGGAAARLATDDLPRYASAHGLASAVLLAYGCSVLLDGPVLLLTLAVEAAALLTIGNRLGDATLRRAGHGLSIAVGGWWMSRIVFPEIGDPPLVTTAAISELVVLAVAAAASTQVGGHRGRQQSGDGSRWWVRDLYRGAALVGWLAWWWNELALIENGHAYVSAVWAVTAAVLVTAGTKTGRQRVQYAGLGTLAVFVAKLFLVDLAALPALLRIVLFLASGAGLLALSYWLPRGGGEGRD